MCVFYKTVANSFVEVKGGDPLPRNFFRLPGARGYYLAGSPCKQASVPVIPLSKDNG